MGNWQIHISERTNIEGWGKSTVSQLALFIQTQEPESKGFSHKNLWRMKQFYETYSHLPKLSTLWRELSWSHNLVKDYKMVRVFIIFVCPILYKNKLKISYNRNL